MFSVFQCNKFVLSAAFKAFTVFEMPYYAVAIGRKVGIFHNWSECEIQVKGFTGAKFKKFGSESEAKNFILQNGNVSSEPQKITQIKPTKLPYDVGFKKKYCTKTVLPTIEIKDEPVAKPITNSKNTSDDLFDSSEEFENEIGKVMDDLESGKDNKSTSQRKTIMIDPIPICNNSSKRAGDNISIESYGKRKKSDARIIDEKFVVDESGFVVVYTDGACSKNGTKKARAGLGVYFGEDHPLNVSEPVSGRATNNCGEIQAATKAIRISHSEGVKKLAIYTDSQFVINSVTKWFPGWKRKGWKLASGEPVKNVIDFKDLDDALKLLEVRWVYVAAHRGTLGNERADQLAKEGAAMYKNKM